MRPEKSIGGMNKILIRSPNWVGDALMITPAIHRLRISFPKAYISVLAKPWVTPVFEASPDVDRVISYQKPGRHQGIGGMWRLAQELKTSGFDTVVHFPHSFEAVWISFLSRIPVRIGYAAEGRGLFLSDCLYFTAVREKEHQVQFFFHLLEPMGIREDPSAEKNPLCLKVDQQSLQQAEARLHALGIGPSDFLVGMAPGAVYGSAKCWPFNRFEQLAERLKKEWQVEVIFLGTDDDTLAGSFKENINGHHLLGKTTLGEALALTQKCRVMICNDSGLMHAASALNIPLVALFGSTDLNRTGPWGGINRVIKKDFICSPCLKKNCSKTPTCMEAITVDEVWETLVSLKGQSIF